MADPQCCYYIIRSSERDVWNRTAESKGTKGNLVTHLAN
jgi:hypothetical protein